MAEPAETYKANYAILKETAEALRNPQEPDIDALIPMIDRALAAYKACKARIEEVKRVLDEKMPSQEKDC